MIAAQPPARVVSSSRFLVSTLVSKVQPFGRFFSLPPSSSRLSGVSARIDRLRVFLQDPDRAARLAQQMHGLARVKRPDRAAPDQRGHVGVLHLGDHLRPGHVPAPAQLDAVEVLRFADEELDFVHHPEASAVDRAHVHFELCRQLLGIDLLVGLGVDGDRCRRIDVGPLGLASADKGPHPVEGKAAGVLEAQPAQGFHTGFQFHLISCFGWV